MDNSITSVQHGHTSINVNKMKIKLEHDQDNNVQLVQSKYSKCKTQYFLLVIVFIMIKTVTVNNVNAILRLKSHFSLCFSLQSVIRFIPVWPLTPMTRSDGAC